jgi:hypothetical protein
MVDLFAITAQTGENDPTSLVEISDLLSAQSLPGGETFQTLETSGPGEVLRGVAFAPVPEPGSAALFVTALAGLAAFRRRKRG